MKWLMCMALGVGVLLLENVTVAAASCQPIHGRFTLTQLAGPTCTSIVGLCYVGEFRGSFQGESLFLGTSVIATSDTPTTGVILVTGDTTITTRTGTVDTKDAIVLATTPDGTFAEVDTIVGGTGALSGVTGRVTATGQAGPGGTVEGVYDGVVCRP